ncbi:Uncharacterised protein [Mycobacteroides abscessus subsp. abscessus]|nr:Uncharacterised protein [Mycobacteroides abscessus subsp. abscessus]
MSALAATGTSIAARAQSLDRLVTFTICPFGTVITSPSALRSVVMRRVTSSTVPSAISAEPVTAIRTTSPKPYWRSVMRKNPARMSCTMRCAPKPSAAPSTAAGATRPVTWKPRRCSTSMPTST